MTLPHRLLVVVMSIPLVVVFRSLSIRPTFLRLERDALVISGDPASIPPTQWPALVNSYEGTYRRA